MQNCKKHRWYPAPDDRIWQRPPAFNDGPDGPIAFRDYIGAMEEAMLIARANFTTMLRRGAIGQQVPVVFQGMVIYLPANARIHIKIIRLCNAIQGQRRERNEHASKTVQRLLLRAMHGKTIGSRKDLRIVFNQFRRLTPF